MVKEGKELDVDMPMELLKKGASELDWDEVRWMVELWVCIQVIDYPHTIGTIYQKETLTGQAAMLLDIIGGGPWKHKKSRS